MTLRVNIQRQSREEYAERLRQAGLTVQAHEFVDTALVLDSPVSVDRLPDFHDGAVSVQDAAAQLAAPLMILQPGQRVLDACAAPGGKLTHLLERQPGLDCVWAVDHDRIRLGRVRENLAREQMDATLICGDASCPADWWDRQPFDRILLDAPCSATGVIRRHPDIKVLRRARDIAPLVHLQQAILDALWPLLSPGGRLLYVTCSILAEENHQQMAAFLDRHADAHEDVIEAAWGRQLEAGRQILPGEAGMDGFYYASLMKG